MDEPLDGQAVRRDVSLAFAYSYRHEDWVMPLEDALAGVRAQDAAWKPAPGVHSVWQIVLHITAWTDNIVQRMTQRMRGETLGKPPEGAWPPLPAALDEAAWQDAQQRLWQELAALDAHIETMPLTASLDCGSVGYSHFADLLCRFTHNAYHIGQITKLREWQAASEEVKKESKGINKEPDGS